MGQCGCSDTAPDFQLPGPDGITYAIQIYPSCHYCSAPAGVDIYRMDVEEVELWLDGVPEAPFTLYSESNQISGQLAIPVLEPAALISALGGNYEIDEDGTEIAEEDIRLVLPEAVHQTLNQWVRTRRQRQEEP